MAGESTIGHGAHDGGGTLGAASTYYPRTLEMAERSSDRHIERLAPERGAARRSRALGTLSFADRVISPYLARTPRVPTIPIDAAVGDLQSTEDVVASSPLAQSWTSWIFPFPWYADGVTADEAARAAVVQRQRPARPASPMSSSLPLSARLRPASAADTRSIADTRSTRDTRSIALPARAWNSQVSAEAEHAAVWMMRVTDDLARDAGLQEGPSMGLAAGRAGRPGQIGREVGQSTGPGDAATATGRGSSQSRRLGSVAQALSSLMVYLMPPAEVASLGRGRDSGGDAAGSAGTGGAGAAKGARVEQVSPTRRRILRALARQRSPEVGSTAASQAASPAPPQKAPVSAPISTSGPASTSDTSPMPPRQPSAAERAMTLFAEQLAAGRSLASSTLRGQGPEGPRVALPAGLSGLVAGLRAAEVVAQPLASPVPRSMPAALRSDQPGYRGFDTVYLQPVDEDERADEAAGEGRTSEHQMRAISGVADTASLVSEARGMAVARANSALSAVGVRMPRGMASLSWADRWLARMVGASPAAADAVFAHGRPAAAGRARPLGPAQVFLQGGPLSASSSSQSSLAAEAAASAISTSPRPAFRIDDNEAVPDEVFAAILAARAAQPGPSPRGGGPTHGPGRDSDTSTSPTVQRRQASPVDALAHHVAPPPGAGLRTALASSPMAPALSALSSVRPTTVFDVRSISRGMPAGTPLERGRHGGGSGQSPWSQLLVQGLSPWQGFVYTTPPRVIEAGAEAPLATAMAPGKGARPGASQRSVSSAVSERRALDDTPGGSMPPAGAAATVLTSAHTAASDGAPAVVGPSAARTLSGEHVPQGRADATQAATILPSTSSYAGPSRPGPSVFRFTGDYTRPGQVAAQAEAWSSGHESRAADLALEFVSPELLWTARRHGLAAPAAVEAARLDSAGAAGIRAVASAVDLAFIEVFSDLTSGAGTSERARTSTPPAGRVSGAGDTGPAGVSGSARSDAAFRDPTGPSSTSSSHVQAASRLSAGLAGTVASGRRPRGAFLWPKTSVEALGIAPMTVTATAEAGIVPALDLVAAGSLLDASARAQMAGGLSGTSHSASVATSIAAVSPSGTLAAPASFTGPQGQGMALAPDMPTADLPEDSIIAAVAPLATYVTPTWQAPSTPSIGDGGAGAESATAALSASAESNDMATLMEIGRQVGRMTEVAAAMSPHMAASAGRRGPLAQVPREFVSLYSELLRAPQGQSRSAAVRAAYAVALASRQRQGPMSPTAASAVSSSLPSSSAAGHRSAIDAAGGAAALHPAMAMVYAGGLTTLPADAAAAAPMPMSASFSGTSEASGASGTVSPAAVSAQRGPTAARSPQSLTGLAAARPLVVPTGVAATSGGAAQLSASASASLSALGPAHAGARFGDVGAALHAFVAPGYLRAGEAFAGDVPMSGADRRGAGAAADAPSPERSDARLRAPASMPPVQTGGAAAASSSAVSSATGPSRTGSASSLRAAATSPSPSAQQAAAATAMRDMVQAAQTKRARGDASIPAWFEQAARHMFADVSGSDHISIAEMTLVAAAPPAQVATASKTANSAITQAPAAAATVGADGQEAASSADIEQMAQEVYAEICRLIQIARERNGDTWQ